MKQPHHVLVIFLSHERSVSRGHAKNGIKILEGACTITLHKRIPNPFSTPAKSANRRCERGAGYHFVAAILLHFLGEVGVARQPPFRRKNMDTTKESLQTLKVFGTFPHYESLPMLFTCFAPTLGNFGCAAGKDVPQLLHHSQSRNTHCYRGRRGSRVSLQRRMLHQINWYLRR